MSFLVTFGMLQRGDRRILCHPRFLCSLISILSVATMDGQPINQTVEFLEIAHINDHHAHFDPETLDINIEGIITRTKIGGFPALAALFNSLPPNVIKIHAGDALTGTSFSFFKGKADAALMNSICFDVFTLGNHEFDDGEAVLAKFLDHLRDGACNTSVLSANIIPKVGTVLAPLTPGDYIKPWVSAAGARLGAAVAVVSGITIKSTTTMSSQPLPTTVFLDEVVAAQAAIDDATARGYTRIVLTTHQGYDADLALAAQLRGVDAIVGGHSHSLLGDGAGVGLVTKGPYPTTARDADGRLVCVAQVT
jgi:5'-nucleotidase / UDP-sugar diphosphatase